MLLGANAGLFLLLVLLVCVALAATDLLPITDRWWIWAGPMVMGSLLLASAWATRARPSPDAQLIWYIVFGGALSFCGSALGALLVEILVRSGPAGLNPGLLPFSLLLFMGALLGAADLVMVGVYLLSLLLSTTVFGWVAGMSLPTPHLMVLGGLALSLPLATLWGFFQQRELVQAAAERDAVLGSYQDARDEAEQLRKRINDQVRQQKEVERELYLAKEVAESAGIAKTEFLATMSHEIRTPLNGIVPILEILRDTPLDEEQGEFVTTALNSSHHLLNLINDILDYSKIEAGKLELETIELNVPEVIESVISLMSKAAERRGLRLHSKLAKNVPIQVRGDPFRLRQVLTNLVGNAIKFTEKGSVTVEVNRHASSPKEVVLLFAVRDTGIGMSEETRVGLFQEFSQADASTTRKYGGTGLGLVICQRLVGMMGGRIGVKSEQNKGSVFWFLVPMRRALHEVPSARQSLQGVRVLLAAFDELERQRIDSYLHEWEMLSEQASGTADALTKLKASAKLGASWSYDVLMVDAEGIGSEAGSLVKSIRKNFELSSLVVMAVDAFPSVAPVLKEAGITEVINRPVQEQELRNRLYRLLDVETHRSLHELEGERRVLMPDAAFNLADEHRSVGSPPAETVVAAKSSAKTTLDDNPLVGRVLVVEDNPVNLSVVKKLLQRFGLTCEAARDGVEAVQAVRNTQYDLVLMDVQMPKMDGLQATGQIRRREQDQGLARMPIVAMTANAMAGDREKCIDSGMDDYMSKPVKPADLKNMLRQWLPMHETLAKETRVARSSTGAGSVQAQEVSAMSTQKQPPVSAPAAPASGADENVLDKEVLGELFDIMESESVALLQEYLDNAPGLLAGIVQAVQGNNAESLVLPAHSLKSSSANVGAMKVSALAKKLEFMGREDNMVESVTTMQAIQGAYVQAEGALKEIIRRGSLS